MDSPPSAKRKRLNNDSINNSINNSIIDIQSQNDISDTDDNVGRRVARVAASNLIDRPSAARPVVPDIDIGKITETLLSKNIVPSTLKFGFLGLGIIGQGIVKNLLNSGHSVNIWNRTSSTSRKFGEHGAEICRTPLDVFEQSDITFSCVSDPRAVKDMVFGNCGILQANNFHEKGYVEMTGIDAETSHDISSSIMAKGGRYLEAQVQGSKVEAIEGKLIVLAAGERELFDDCQSCFSAMGSYSFFLGEIGNATKMSLVIHTLNGILIAGLAEALSLADRAGLTAESVMQILELTNMNSNTLVSKGKSIQHNDYSAQLPLMHMQKDLRLTLNMAESLEQPLPLTSACNEIFKHAKRQGYSHHDASAVYITSKL